MPIPNAAQAFVPPGKLTGYLLDLTHPVGGPKARFFRAHGFHADLAHRLELALLRLALSDETVEVPSENGRKFVAIGDLPTPRGTVLRIRTVWVIEPTDPRPRFITAYPS